MDMWASCLRHDFTKGRQKYEMDFRCWPPLLQKPDKIPDRPAAIRKTKPVKGTVSQVPPYQGSVQGGRIASLCPGMYLPFVAKCFRGPRHPEENYSTSIFTPEYSNGPITIKLFDFCERCRRMSRALDQPFLTASILGFYLQCLCLVSLLHPVMTDP